MRDIKRAPTVVDIYVGARIRLRRQLLGLSQDALAAAIDTTYQQVQKYETGVNRIGAGRLWKAAIALEVPVQYFFQGLSEDHSGSSEAHREASEGELDALARAFAEIQCPDRQQAVLAQIQQLYRQNATAETETGSA